MHSKTTKVLERRKKEKSIVLPVLIKGFEGFINIPFTSSFTLQPYFTLFVANNLSFHTISFQVYLYDLGQGLDRLGGEPAFGHSLEGVSNE